MQAGAEPGAADGEVAVASPGISPISAFAAVGLALSTPQSVSLFENRNLRWSARTFLPRDQEAAGIRVGSSAEDQDHWTLDRRSLAGGAVPREGESPFAGTSRIRWRHLGCLTETDLAHLESLAAARSLVQVPDTGSGGLVWCMLASQGGLLETSYTLGRLVGQLRPRRLEILLFPDAWADMGRPGWLEEIRRKETIPEDPGSTSRCAELAALACGGISLEVHRVVGSENLIRSFGVGGKRDGLWQRVARNMNTGGSAR